MRDYFIEAEDSVVRTWGEAGIGGWRLDVGGDIDPGGPANDYWELFREVVREINPEAVIIGEEWQDASSWLNGAEWDAVMNYRLRRGILGFARDAIFTDNDANGDNIIRPLGPSELDALIESIREDYPPPAYHAMMNLLGSHDTSRVFFVVGNDPARQKLAALVHHAARRADHRYTATRSRWTRQANRIAAATCRTTRTTARRIRGRTRKATPTAATRTCWRYQTLGTLRKEHPALREGERITLLADNDTGVLAYLRVDAEAGDAALVVINQSDVLQTATLDLAGFGPLALELEPSFGGRPIAVSEGPVTVTIPPLSGEIWVGTASAPFTAPDAPTNLNAEGEPGAVSLAWDAIPDASGYVIYRSPVEVGGFERITDEPVSDAAYVDESVTDGYRYYYTVAAVGADGLVGAQSDPVGVTPSAAISETFYLRDGAHLERAEPLSLPLEVGTLAEVSAAILIEGVTEADGPAEGVRAQGALVPVGEDLASAAWQPMTYAGEFEGADVYSAQFQPSAMGDYQAVARFSTDAGETWHVVALPDGAILPVTVTPGEDVEPPEAPAAIRVPRATTAGVQVEWDASGGRRILPAHRTVRGQSRCCWRKFRQAKTPASPTPTRPSASGTPMVSAVDTAYRSEQIIAEEVVVERPIVSDV